jgi:hypothetical protein
MIFDMCYVLFDSAGDKMVMLTDYEYERSRLLDVYKDCLNVMRFKHLLRMNMINDDKDVFIYEKI